MDASWAVPLAVAAMFALIALGVPIGVALLVTGAAGYVFVAGPAATIAQVGLITWEFGHNPVFAAIPLFLLMGQIVFRAGFGKDFFDAVYSGAASLRGRVGVAAVWSCVGFGSVTGSSFAAIATMGSIVLPEMRRLGYSGRTASGVLASASTLAILVPPSVTLIFYGIMTETSIGALFLAGIVPALILGTVFSVWIICTAPRAAAAAESSRAPGGRAWLRVAPLLALFIAVIGGIYLGIVSPTEAATFGVVIVTVQALLGRRLSLGQLYSAAAEAAAVTGAIFAIVIGGTLLTRCLAQTEVAAAMVTLAASLVESPALLMLIIMVVCLVLGALLDALSMLVLTLPLLTPLVRLAGFDMVWFGVFIVIMTELALIVPPMGMNVFVLHRVAPDISLGEMFSGVAPYVALLIIFAVLIIYVPEVVLWLPKTLR